MKFLNHVDPALDFKIKYRDDCSLWYETTFLQELDYAICRYARFKEGNCIRFYTKDEKVTPEFMQILGLEICNHGEYTMSVTYPKPGVKYT